MSRSGSVYKGSGPQHRSPNVITGGHDAPLDAGSNRWFLRAALVIAVVGVALIALVIATR